MRLKIFETVIIMVIAFAAVFGAKPLLSQSESDDLTVLDEISVQGRQLEEKLSTELADYGHKVQVIEGQALVDTGYPTLYRALGRLVPGLSLPTNTPSAQLATTPTMRLNGSLDFLVLLDGVRLNNRMMGRSMHPDTIGVHIVDRVEILSGGEGLFYGTDATGGVINIVTKSPSEEESGSIRLSYGSYNNKDVSAYVTGGTKGASFLIYGHLEDFDGYQLLDTAIWENAGTIVPEMNNPIGGRKADMKRSNYGIKFNKEFDLSGPQPARFDISFFKNDRKFHNPNQNQTLVCAVTIAPGSCTVYDQYIMDETITYAKWSHDVTENYSYFVKAYYHEWWAKETSLRANGTYTYKDAKYGYEDWGIHLLNSYRFDQGSELLFGMEYQNYFGKDGVIGMPATQHEEVIAGYFNFRPYLSFWPGWKTSFGMRYNRLKENSSVNWNLSSRMPFWDDTLYLAVSAGTAFKLPSSTSLFAQLVGNRTSEGNPDLKPQTSRFYNLAVGGNWQYGGLELFFFWENISDRIATVQGSGSWIPHLNQFADKYQNIPGKTKIRGYTFSGRLGPFAGFSSTASFTRQEEIRNGEKQEYLTLFPENFGNVIVRWDGNIGDWKAGVGVINSYTGKMKTRLTNFNTITVKEYGKYWTTDIDLHVKPLENLTIALQLSNIFEKGEVYNGWFRLRPQPNGPLAGKESSDGFYYYGNKAAPFTATLSVTYDF